MNSIAIIGCGYVGNSLITLFKNKFSIIGYDISDTTINNLKKNHFHKNVIYTTNESLLKNCNIYIIAVPTNIKENQSIDLSHLYKVKKTLTKYLQPNNIIILESTIYIGGTRELFSNLLKNNIYIGYSPERISPGEYDNSKNIPKIISGLNLESLDAINLIYSQVVDVVVPVSSTETAELCKLYENCFRVINIAYINEIADLSQKHNINFQEIRDASNTKPFGFMSFYPGFGIGGNCLPHNPYYLMHGLQDYKKELPILYNSINSLNNRPVIKAKKFIKFNKIIIIGTGFKPNQKLCSMSPTLTLYNELKKQKKNVLIFNNILKLTLDYIKKFDCVILGSQYIALIDNLIIKTYKLSKYGKVFTF
jgi:nucleotide sugar dehydrogenase